MAFYLNKCRCKTEEWEKYSKDLFQINISQFKSESGTIMCNVEELHTFLSEKNLEVKMTRENDNYLKMEVELPQKEKQRKEQKVKQKV